MLQRLLELVAEGGLHSHTDLARELGVSEGLVGQMIEDLARMGYLRPVAGNCQSQCTGCSLVSQDCKIDFSILQPLKKRRVERRPTCPLLFLRSASWGI